MLRRIRGAVVLGLLWAAVWLPVGFIAGLAFRWIIVPFRPVDWLFVALFAGLGFASGTTFGALLSRLERDRTIEGIALGRLAIWGSLAGAGIPILLCIVVLAVVPPDVHLARSAYGLFTLLGLLGAATAELSISLAKRAAPREIITPPA
jgi:hypothetical protein